MISAFALSFSHAARPVLDGVHVAPGPHEIVGVIGPDGSGKSTLLRILSRALAPRTGVVSLDELALAVLGPAEVARQALTTGRSMPAELPYAAEDLVLASRSRHPSMLEHHTPADRALARTALREAGGAHLATRPFTSLSAGERQRVLVARAVARQAPNILLDEPDPLDTRHQAEILDLVARLGLATVAVLCDPDLALRTCHRVVLLDAGRIVASGPAREILRPLPAVHGIDAPWHLARPALPSPGLDATTVAV